MKVKSHLYLNFALLNGFFRCLNKFPLMKWQLYLIFMQREFYLVRCTNQKSIYLSEIFPLNKFPKMGKFIFPLTRRRNQLM